MPLRIACLTVALVFSLIASPALADDIDDAQAVIESQIAAFLADDADGAYFHAAPGIKQLYNDPQRFFEMVRRGYAPVYRPDNFAFGRGRTLSENRVVQEVLISGPDGEDWTAIYVLERQADGAFKINGVQMIKSAAPEI